MQMGNFDEAETLLVEALNKARLFSIAYVTILVWQNFWYCIMFSYLEERQWLSKTFEVWYLPLHFSVARRSFKFLIKIEVLLAL